METTSSTYEVLYKLEMLGLCKPLKGFDLMYECDIIQYILLNTRRLDVVG